MKQIVKPKIPNMPSIFEKENPANKVGTEIKIKKSIFPGIDEIESLEKEKNQIIELMKNFNDEKLSLRLKEIPIISNNIYAGLKNIDISNEAQEMEQQGLEIYRNMVQNNDYSKAMRLCIIECLLNKDLSGRN